VGEAAEDILAEKPPVQVNGRREPQCDLSEGFSEAGVPERHEADFGFRF